MFAVPEVQKKWQKTCQDVTNDESFQQCPTSCDVVTTFRSIDGCCNNINRRDNGRAPKPFARSLDPAYEDGKDGKVPRGGIHPSSLPNPRSVSEAVHMPGQGVESSKISLMVMMFGQFLDHDITLTPELGKVTNIIISNTNIFLLLI